MNSPRSNSKEIPLMLDVLPWNEGTYSHFVISEAQVVAAKKECCLAEGIDVSQWNVLQQRVFVIYSKYVDFKLQAASIATFTDKVCEAIIALYCFDTTLVTQVNVQLLCEAECTLENFRHIVHVRVEDYTKQECQSFETTNKTTFQRAVFAVVNAQGNFSDSAWNFLLKGSHQKLTSFACLRGQSASYIVRVFQAVCDLSDTQKSFLAKGFSVSSVATMSDALCLSLHRSLHRLEKKYPGMLTKKAIVKIVEESKGGKESESLAKLQRNEGVGYIDFDLQTNKLDDAVNAAFLLQGSKRTITSRTRWGKWSDDKKKAYVILAKCGLNPDKDIAHWWSWAADYNAHIITLFYLDPQLVTQENIDALTSGDKNSPVRKFAEAARGLPAFYQLAVKSLLHPPGTKQKGGQHRIALEDVQAFTAMNKPQQAVAEIYAERGFKGIPLIRKWSTENCQMITTLNNINTDFLTAKTIGTPSTVSSDENLKAFKAILKRNRGIIDQTTMLQKAARVLANAEGEVSDSLWNKLWQENNESSLETIAIFHGKNAAYINDNYQHVSKLLVEQKTLLKLFVEKGMPLACLQRIPAVLCAKVSELHAAKPAIVTYNQLLFVLESRDQAGSLEKLINVATPPNSNDSVATLTPAGCEAISRSTSAEPASLAAGNNQDATASKALIPHVTGSLWCRYFSARSKWSEGNFSKVLTRISNYT